MKKKTSAVESRHSAFQLIGKKEIPAPLLRRIMADRKRQLAAQFQEKSAIWLEAAKYRAILERSASRQVNRSEAAHAVEGLRKLSQRLAKRKLAAPVVPKIQPGILAGGYTVRVPPPYDHAYTYSKAYQGNPSMHISADASTGQMSASVVSDFRNASYGLATAEVGIYFTSPLGPASLTVSASLAINFSAWVNSLYGGADSLAGPLIGINSYAPDGSQTGASGALAGNGIAPGYVNGGVDFDFGSETQMISAQLDVGLNDQCYVYLNLSCVASGFGWPVPPNRSLPASLAGADVALTVPSFTLDFQLIPVIAP